MFIYLISSYIIGNLLLAYWVGKWKGTDLRTQKSGNLGARNAGAVLGKGAFLLTFLGDAGKGALVVLLGFHFGFELWVINLAGLLVVCGHLFPIWLKGKGGKGISTFIGVTFFLTPTLFLAMLVICLAFIPYFKSATLSMLAGFSAFILMAVVSQVLLVVWPLLIAIILIVFRHSSDIKEAYENRFTASN